MTKLEILRETKDYYSADITRRAYNRETGFCQYYLERDGIIRNCAVGRCLINPEQQKNNAESVTTTNWFRDSLLKQEYRGHVSSFWLDLQKFHDCEAHWNPYGLTEDGVSRYNKLCKKWAD